MQAAPRRRGSYGWGCRGAPLRPPPSPPSPTPAAAAPIPHGQGGHPHTPAAARRRGIKRRPAAATTAAHTRGGPPPPPLPSIPAHGRGSAAAPAGGAAPTLSSRRPSGDRADRVGVSPTRCNGRNPQMHPPPRRGRRTSRSVRRYTSVKGGGVAGACPAAIDSAAAAGGDLRGAAACALEERRREGGAASGVSIDSALRARARACSALVGLDFERYFVECSFQLPNKNVMRAGPFLLAKMMSALLASWINCIAGRHQRQCSKCQKNPDDDDTPIPIWLRRSPRDAAASPRTDPSPATIPRSDPSPATSLRTDASPPRAAEAASTVIAALLPQRPSTVVIDDGAVVIHLHYGGHPPDTQSRAPSPAEQLPAPAPRRANPPRSSMYGPLDGAVAVAAATQVAQAMDASLDAAAVVADLLDPLFCPVLVVADVGVRPVLLRTCADPSFSSVLNRAARHNDVIVKPNVRHT
ncbi:hypothetical protein BU14_1363s0003 [Porphyra umbilicalis]|uniref:Uncharacterized protein n=1 Tax=Porphyra umbilicalis TaxID=2786 RepID=A0A1X6NLS6_PORUM|nr:hypothetical protein BU14_1363s0003 [Porphyra umbilicalis]|eukprot:OSX69599.1 hypothetical protein BU14_1363s0003 [Porphyra umbilicalis]